jgi:hypothetical protein
MFQQRTSALSNAQSHLPQRGEVALRSAQREAGRVGGVLRRSTAVALKDRANIFPPLKREGRIVLNIVKGDTGRDHPAAIAE